MAKTGGIGASLASGTAGTTRAQAARAASARSEVSSFIVMDVMRAAAALERAGRSIVHMEVGQPATPAPAAARAAVARALEASNLGYTLALGMPELRARIALHYRDWYGLAVPAERIVVTSGSSAAFVLAFLALFDAGDRVAMPEPGYPCYRHILSALGQRAVAIETGPSSRWMPEPHDVERLARSSPLAGILVASPANPTGTMLEADRLAALVAASERHGAWFISDEIYHGLTYGIAPESALRYGDDVVVINSFSKYFSMTGWRVGWMVVPERLVAAVERLAQNLYISPPAVAQVAALGAFEGFEELEANKQVYLANRRLLLDELPKAGIGEIVPADGAFYLYADVGRHTDDSLAFTRQMLEEAGVAATPGLDFDPVRGQRYVRFSYAGATADMAEAARRLIAWPRLRR